MGSKGITVGFHHMTDQFLRTKMLLGEEGFSKLQQSRVAVFGIGGVGGYVAEALVRTGLGAIDIIDNDTVSLTNLNRQIIATHDTVGMQKVDVMEQRLLAINPDVKIKKHTCFFLPETAGEIDFSQYDYIVDAIDTVTGKIALVMESDKAGVPIISSMGTGNKLDPAKLVVTDIYKTKICPLAKVMRRELKKRQVKKLKVVYSEEIALKPAPAEEEGVTKRAIPGSLMMVPASAGLMIASEVVRDLLKEKW